MEEEIGVTYLKAKECQGFAGHHSRLGVGCGTDSPSDRTNPTETFGFRLLISKLLDNIYLLFQAQSVALCSVSPQKVMHLIYSDKKKII